MEEDVSGLSPPDKHEDAVIEHEVTTILSAEPAILRETSCLAAGKSDPTEADNIQTSQLQSNKRAELNDIGDQLMPQSPAININEEDAPDVTEPQSKCSVDKTVGTKYLTDKQIECAAIDVPQQLNLLTCSRDRFVTTCSNVAVPGDDANEATPNTDDPRKPKFDQEISTDETLEAPQFRATETFTVGASPEKKALNDQVCNVCFMSNWLIIITSLYE